jgi:hypothetical protein
MYIIILSIVFSLSLNAAKEDEKKEENKTSKLSQVQVDEYVDGDGKKHKVKFRYGFQYNESGKVNKEKKAKGDVQKKYIKNKDGNLKVKKFRYGFQYDEDDPLKVNPQKTNSSGLSFSKSKGSSYSGSNDDDDDYESSSSKPSKGLTREDILKKIRARRGIK